MIGKIKTLMGVRGIMFSTRLQFGFVSDGVVVLVPGVARDMYVTFRNPCFTLVSFVSIMGLVMMTLYMMMGLGVVVWFVLTHSTSQKSVTQISLNDSLIILGIVLVVSLVGLVTSLLVVVGVRTEQAKLLLPWRVVHGTVILACYTGGLYQALHYTILVQHQDIVSACLSVCPVVAGIFITFLWVITNQLATTFMQNKSKTRVREEKRASLACLHGSLSGQAELEERRGCRSVKSIRTLKRKKRGDDIRRWRSLDYLEPGEDDYWGDGRGGSLPRQLERTGSGSYLASEYRVCSTELVRRRHTSCLSLHSVKSVTIHPEVTQYSYSHSIPR